jgi:hypothetical protein
VRHTCDLSPEEAGARACKVPGQSGIHCESKDSLGYMVKSYVKKRKKKKKTIPKLILVLLVRH